MKKISKSLTKCIVTFVMTAVMVLGGISIPAAAASSTEFLWVGGDGSAHVDTGLGNGTGTEGLWYFADDSADGGKSELILSGNTDPVASGDYIRDEDVRKSGGICGTIKLKKGYSLL